MLAQQIVKNAYLIIHAQAAKMIIQLKMVIVN